MIDKLLQTLVEAELTREPAGFRASYRIGEDLQVFKDHFPGKPLLPGVFEVEMVRTGLDRATGKGHRLKAVLNAKFLRPIKPGELVEIEAAVKDHAEGQRIDATVQVAGEMAATMTLLVATLR